MPASIQKADTKFSLSLDSYVERTQQANRLQNDIAKAEQGEKVDLNQTAAKLDTLKEALKKDSIAIGKAELTRKLELAHQAHKKDLHGLTARINALSSKANSVPLWATPVFYKALVAGGVAVVTLALAYKYGYIGSGSTPTPTSTPTSTPKPETPTPTPTPKPETPTPESGTPTPKPETPTPESETPTPKPETPTPESETPTPKPDNPTPTSPAPALTPMATQQQQTLELLTGSPVSQDGCWSNASVVYDQSFIGPLNNPFLNKTATGFGEGKRNLVAPTNTTATDIPDAMGAQHTGGNITRNVSDDKSDNGVLGSWTNLTHVGKSLGRAIGKNPIGEFVEKSPTTFLATVGGVGGLVGRVGYVWHTARAAFAAAKVHKKGKGGLETAMSLKNRMATYRDVWSTGLATGVGIAYAVGAGVAGAVALPVIAAGVGYYYFAG